MNVFSLNSGHTNILAAMMRRGSMGLVFLALSLRNGGMTDSSHHSLCRDSQIS